MNKLYQKSPLLFALLWVLVYVVGCSVCDEASRALGKESLFTLLYTLLLSLLAIQFLLFSQNRKRFSFQKPSAPRKAFLWYLPLFLLCSCNLWFGIQLPLSPAKALAPFLTMILVGFLEEFIFRCLLFRAMAKNGVKSAILVSSLSFGIGHLVNLFNGSGADLTSNLCQVASAVAFGFLFVVIVYRGNSVIPCIVCHSTINALSVFAKDPPSPFWQILTSLLLTAGAASYAAFLWSRLPEPNVQSN